ncbi:MAG: hypothetical protein LBD23_08955, partial [Oscillospiraceae bacterium]|nr:hypothetical protein [Oscillospiraceae bacterium]
MVINASNLNLNTTYNNRNTKPFTPNAENGRQTFVNQDIVDFATPIKRIFIEGYESASSKGIDWWQVTNSLTINEGNFYIGDIGEYLNNASTLYINLESLINREFTGSEKTEQLNTLNEIFNKAI